MRQSVADCSTLVALTGLTRLAFATRYPYDLDSVNFLLGLAEFDPQVHQPHPPGYYLYVQAGRLAQRLFAEPHTGLVFLSVLASCGSVVLIYALAREWFHRKAAIAAGLMFVLSPLCWFYGTVALTYLPEAFFAALVGFLSWRTYSGNAAYALPGAIALGLACGVRQSSLLFLGPVWLLSLSAVRARRAILSVIALGVVVAAWFFPMLQESGGVDRYFASLSDLWNRVAARNALIGTSDDSLIPALGNLADRIYTLFRVCALCFLAAAPLPLLRRFPPMDRRKRAFLWTWLLPGGAFFLLVFLPFVNSGYFLVLGPPLFAVLGCQAVEWMENSSAKPSQKWVFGSLLAMASLVVFLYAPLYFSRARVEFIEGELARAQAAVRQLSDPESTLVVAFDFHMLGFRHAGYLLPEYLTLQFPEMPFEDGPRVFAMQQSKTFLCAAPPIESYREFILFPVPNTGVPAEYMEKVLSRFPPGRLRRQNVRGQDFVVGSAADLQWLFPVTTRERMFSVSDLTATERHSEYDCLHSEPRQQMYTPGISATPAHPPRPRAAL